MKNIAIITARSGSKEVKDKNIKLLAGKPLMAYSIEAAIKSKLFDVVMLSTDSEEYAQIGRDYGAEVPFLRSERTSSDGAGSWEAVIEVLEKYRESGHIFDTICLLQPTSPLRTFEDIVDGYNYFYEKSADAITSVCESEHPPQYIVMLDETLSLKEHRKTVVDMVRQKRGKYYRHNGAIYIRKIEYFEESIRLKAEEEYAFVMERNRSVDIDSIEDFEYAEYLIIKRKG